MGKVTTQGWQYLDTLLIVISKMVVGVSFTGSSWVEARDAVNLPMMHSPQQRTIHPKMYKVPTVEKPCSKFSSIVFYRLLYFFQ